MMGAMTHWDEVEPDMREMAYSRLLADPNYLLSYDTELGVQAERYHARLIGHDEQHVSDMWIPSALPVIKVPIVQRPTWLDSVDRFPASAMRVAFYQCQNALSVLTFAAELAPADVKVPANGTFRVAYLIYKRRLEWTPPEAGASTERAR